uniref:Putative ovule protein n=1 Tax=Solanum chacoense TaxID=4108 RepID=A0A0V0H0T4_SOLCH
MLFKFSVLVLNRGSNIPNVYHNPKRNCKLLFLSCSIPSIYNKRLHPFWQMEFAKGTLLSTISFYYLDKILLHVRVCVLIDSKKDYSM